VPEVDSVTKAAIEFGLLGPLSAQRGGREVDLGGVRQRAVVAILLLRGGEPVTSEELAVDLWGGPPPPAGVAEVEAYVSQLRDALGADVIETGPAGHAILPVAGALDVDRFEALLDEGRRLNASGAHEDAARVLGEALALWRGPPLEDFQLAPFAREASGRLEELRQIAIEQRADAERASFAGRSTLPPLRSLRPAESTREARKTVTVLFGDVVAYSTLAERLDPEALRRVMSEFFQRAAAQISKHGGVVEKFVGDEVVAVFGVPVVREDDALRAVRAAVALRDSVTALEAELGPDARLQIRIGLNTGEVMTTDPSSGQAFVTGDSVGLGKRIESAAQPGQILLGPETHALVAHAVEATPLAPISMKGHSDEVACFLLESVDPDATAIPRRHDAPLVGRDGELERLREAFAQAVRERSARMMVVVADAGIGKSRLARELVSQVADRATVLVGRCPPYGEGITFSPLREVFSQVHRDDAVLKAPSYEVFAATRSLLEELAEESPVVMALDDVHWAEETFLDLVEHLASRLSGSRVLLLCLARPDLAERRPAWLQDSATALRLEPLSQADSHSLLEALGAPESVQDGIAEAAEGNPLFMEQLAAIAGETGATSMAGSIRSVLHARLDRLELEDRGVLERGAVAGRSFSLEAVLELTPREEREAAASHLFGLVRKGFLRPDTTGPEEAFRFDHALIRDVVYDATPKALRADLHENMAAWLEARHAPDALVGHQLEQAFLLRRALAVRDEALGARAGYFLRAAAQQAFPRGDLPAAIALLERARGLLPVDDPTLPGLLTELGYARINTGDMPGAAAVLDEAVEVAGSLGDRAAELHARVERQFVRVLTADSTSAEQNVRVADEALAGLGGLDDPLGVARAWWLKSSGDVIACRWKERGEALEQALASARRSNASLDLVGTLSGLLAAALLHGPTPVPDAIVRVEELASSVGSDRALGGAVNANLACLFAMAGSSGEARRIYADVAATYEEFGLRFRRAHMGFVGAQIELLSGSPEGAAAVLRGSTAALAEFGAAGSLVTHRALLAEVLCTLGRLDEAEELAHLAAESTAADDLVTHVLWRSALARVLARRGMPGEAAALAGEARARATGVEFPFLQALALIAAAEAEGAARGARSLLDDARAVLRAKGNLAWLAQLDGKSGDLD
jgi:class 3 adenylate cyclase/tetratricopeptide (TPR) repeat protein